MIKTRIGKFIFFHARVAGLSYAQVQDKYTFTTSKLSQFGFHVLHPFIGYTDLAQKVSTLPLDKIKDLKEPRLTARALMQRAKWLMSQADIAFIDATKGDSTGLPMGVLYTLFLSTFMQKHTVVLMDAQSDMDHATINEVADIIFYDMNDAFQYFAELSALNILK